MTPLRNIPWAGLLIVGILAAMAIPAAGQSERTVLGQPGYLVIEGVRDSASVYGWQDGPDPDHHALVWPEGSLRLPRWLSLDEFGQLDAGVPSQAGLSGTGGSGHLVFEDGIYPISEPLVLADGVWELNISAGELEVRGAQIRYRRPVVEDRTTQANYIFLAGLLLLIIILMRRARRGLRKS